MLYPERKLKILSLFQGKSTLKVGEIASHLGVSVDTVRRDLKQMEAEHLVKYVFGGATLQNTPLPAGQYGTFHTREIKHKEAKHQLAKKALAELADNQVIFINSGTTGAILAQEIVHTQRAITIVTNSLEVVSVLAQGDNPAIETICLGGVLDAKEQSFYGSTCEQELRTYYPDISFLSINAVDTQHGYTDFRTKELALMQIAQQNSKRTVAIMDASKFQRCAPKQVFTPGQIDAIYCDDSLSSNTFAVYEELGISIL